MYANTYQKMEDYYYLQFLSIDFQMFKRYELFFWRISTQGTEM